MGFFRSLTAAGCAALAVRSTMAQNPIQVDWTSSDSIKSASGTVAFGLMQYYNGNETGGIPGNLPQPYYWWECGAMFMTMIDYWYYTGDETYNDVVTEGMLFQVGPNVDFMPPNQTTSEGNDDQGFWGMAAMTAAEVGFPNPPASQPQWLALAQAVFNSQAIRWDTTTCGGGLRWQIFTFNNGYTYKNSISNGCFLNVGARLARYTGNQTYADWVDKTWNWVTNIGLITPTYQVWDGSADTLNCTQFNHIQWSYNAAVYLLGAATMWNITHDPDIYNITSQYTNTEWYNITEGILNGLDIFFQNGSIMYEPACEPYNTCDTDNKSFKAYLARWIANSIKLAPWIEPMVTSKLAASAKAAVSVCNAGPNGNGCGLKWTSEGVNDGSFGVGQQMSVMEAINTQLIDLVRGPYTNKTGGTSIGNPSAGTGGGSQNPTAPTSPITTGDKAGAGILTALVLASIVGGAWWMVM